ncbi:MAG: phage major capsid protein [Dehalococcoidia bacterium]
MIDTMGLKRKAFGLVSDARAITEKAEDENRNLTDGERAEVRRLLDEADTLETQMQVEERGQKYAMGKVGKVSKAALNLADEDRAFLNFVRNGVRGLDSNERRALVEDTTGRYIVSPAVETEFQRSVEKLVVIRQLASKRIINKDRILVRDVTEAAVNWGKLETGAQVDETNPEPSEVYKYVEDLWGLVKIGVDELSDSDYDLITFLGDSFGRAIAEKENQGFILGQGHSEEQPEGICTDATLLANALTTESKDAAEIKDFMQMIYQVPAKYRPGSSWIVNSTIELGLRQLRAEVASGYYGNFLWQPSLIAGAPNTFMGYPIYNQDDMADLTSDEGVIAIFGNFQLGYRILDRLDTTIQRLDEIYAEAGLVGFIVHSRVGGYPIRPSNKALVLLKEKGD